MESCLQEIESKSINIFNSIDAGDNKNNILENEIKYPSLRKEKFNVDEIIEKCKEKNGMELLSYMCTIMHEKKRNMLEMLYKELGKNYLIIMLEKALNIENDGGLSKGKSINAKKEEEKKIDNSLDSNSLNGKKSTGGIFFALIKKDPEGKDILNKASKLDWKQSKQRKKVYKLMDKLNL